MWNQNSKIVCAMNWLRILTKEQTKTIHFHSLRLRFKYACWRISKRETNSAEEFWMHISFFYHHCLLIRNFICNILSPLIFILSKEAACLSIYLFFTILIMVLKNIYFFNTCVNLPCIKLALEATTSFMCHSRIMIVLLSEFSVMIRH